jgi:DNA-binding HxlR family transcriptional regulator
MATQRLRGVWRARLLIELSKGNIHFNSLGRATRVPNPQALSRLLKKLERQGAVIRRLDKVGPPASTSWLLTEHGQLLVGPAVALLAEAAQRRADREIEEIEFKRSRPVIAFERINTGHIDNTTAGRMPEPLSMRINTRTDDVAQ